MMFQNKNEPLAVVIFRKSDFMRQMTGYVGSINYEYVLNASVLLSIVPLLILYAVAQKYFIESVAKVGVKG